MYIQVHDHTRVFLLSFVCTRIKDNMNVCLTEKNVSFLSWNNNDYEGVDPLPSFVWWSKTSCLYHVIDWYSWDFPCRKIHFSYGRAYCFAAVCLSVGQSTNTFRSFTSQRMNKLKWNLLYTLFMIRSRSGLIFGTIKQFSTELCPLDVYKFQLFAVSAHFFHSWWTYRD